MNNQISPEMYRMFSKQLKENWGWYLALGVSLIALGSLAVIYSVTSTIFSILYLGCFLMVLGIFEVVQSFKLHKWSNFFLHLFLGILYLVGGFFIIMNPALNAITLTLLLAIFFVVSGISKIFFALTQHVPHKGWLAVNGILTLILGILIWQQWPVSGLWVIGMFVGIDAILTGCSLIMLSLAAKELKIS